MPEFTTLAVVTLTNCVFTVKKNSTPQKFVSEEISTWEIHRVSKHSD